MAVLLEILDWSRGLPAWQGDAIARLFSNEALGGDDLDDLFALLKLEHGIADPIGRVAQKLNPEQVPVPPEPDTHIKLLALKDLRYVNAIAEKQRLSFSPIGLTVIYGENGSGKSGYSRVLKRACRARDQTEPIHPNANVPLGEAGPAEAVFEIDVNGEIDTERWCDDKAAPAVFSSLAVFDSRCARSYLDDEGDFAYVPYGLDILERLAGTCAKLKEMIESELAVTTVGEIGFAELVGDTTVGKLVESLSEKTKPDTVDALANLTAEELRRQAKLEKVLKEQNPKEKAARLRIRATRIGRLAQNVKDKNSIVDDVAASKLQELISAYLTAIAAADVAEKEFKESPGLLPGTGGDPWKALFEAARKFSIEAFPGRQFPELGTRARCPLCQQPLGEGLDRLKHFEEFVQQEAEKTKRERDRALKEAREELAKQDVKLGMDDELRAEISEIDKELATDTREFESELISRFATIKTAASLLSWGEIGGLPASPAGRLQSLADALNEEVATLEALVDEKARAALLKDYEELTARIRLDKVKSAVLAAIERLDRRAKLNRCLPAVRTNAISLKASELTEKVVSKELEAALNEEFKLLGVGSIQVELKSRADRGKAFHKLRLNLPQAKTLADILSEGEQRAVAIGSFLAEVKIGDSTGGIVFDDPVSSLDHRRRERVARRLAREASQRQVIVFTHDLYFLNLLLDEAHKTGIPIETQSVIRRPEGFGVVNPDLPFEGMNTKARVGALRNRHPQIKKLYESGDEVEHRKQTADVYRQLRVAWERAIEEVLLGSVVLRFRKGVETNRLAGVVVEDADFATVEHWMSKCSNYAHDQALLGGEEVPEPDELLQDINTLDEWRKATEKRLESVRQNRKKNPAHAFTAPT